MNSSTATQDISDRVVRKCKLKNLKWRDFDEFKKYDRGVWVVRISSTDDKKCGCSCPWYQKHENCKHLLGMKIRLKTVTVPAEAKNIPIGQKRKRGRPSKATKALIVQ